MAEFLTPIASGLKPSPNATTLSTARRVTLRSDLRQLARARAEASAAIARAGDEASR